MSAADKSKLNGIESGAKGDQTASEILALLKTVDGAGSGLDADLLDGQSSAYFATASALSSHTGNSNIHRTITSGTAEPSGGSNGDIYLQYE
jgi:3-deoxy-D-arabino-heptulosonate 7-phosphate (DAHP) synthase